MCWTGCFIQVENLVDHLNCNLKLAVDHESGPKSPVSSWVSCNYGQFYTIWTKISQQVPMMEELSNNSILQYRAGKIKPFFESTIINRVFQTVFHGKWNHKWLFEPHNCHDETVISEEGLSWYWQSTVNKVWGWVSCPPATSCCWVSSNNYTRTK